MPPNMPPGWAEVRNAFPPELRDAFEASYSIAYPGDPSKWKDDIAWNLFQVLRLQTTMQAHVNATTERLIPGIRDLGQIIKEASLAHKLNRSASDQASLHLLQAAQVIRDSEVTRKEYEVVRQEAATPWVDIAIFALFWTVCTLAGQLTISTYGTAWVLHRLFPPADIQPSNSPIVPKQGSNES